MTVSKILPISLNRFHCHRAHRQEDPSFSEKISPYLPLQAANLTVHLVARMEKLFRWKQRRFSFMFPLSLPPNPVESKLVQRDREWEKKATPPDLIKRSSTRMVSSFFFGRGKDPSLCRSTSRKSFSNFVINLHLWDLTLLINSPLNRCETSCEGVGDRECIMRVD